MSGGVSAIRGFDYQATVILYRLFEHFDRHGQSALARPEGVDDLDLTWLAKDGSERRRYEQVKKPREDQDGNRKPAPWTLQDVIDELIPNTIANLSGNSHEQLWIVGDEVDSAVSSLVDAGEHAPVRASSSYWRMVHMLARNYALNAAALDQTKRRKLLRWRIPADLPADQSGALMRLSDDFRELVRSAGITDDVSKQYGARAAQIHNCLPGVLSRVRIIRLYGSEEEVARRVQDRLTQRYSLQRSVVENALFRNLRGFINDISKQPGRAFGREEFEIELRCVWPTMLRVKEPPPLDENHIARRDLSERLTKGWSGKAVEVVGVSGSGKTMLASEVLQRSQTADPDRNVYYAEVRPDVRLRDVLAGAAFHLRRLGIAEPFAISVESAAADEDVLTRLAESYSRIARDVLLLIDLVEGTCSAAFARDLAKFVRALSSSACRVAIFGQESAFRELNQLDRDAHGVSRVDIRGFNLDEFIALASRHHPNPDRAVLWNIFQRVTAGRATGLYAQLAQSLVSAPSLDAMEQMAARPAEDILPYAEQQRFGRFSEGVTTAAEKLVCFALPFRRRDAEEIFSADNVGSAVREMLTFGLLRANDEDTFEMHETVRAGLEGTIALDVRRSAHQALADWYGQQDLVTAEILHLVKANNPGKAQVRARESFLRGEQWRALASFVTERRLVSPIEVIGVMAGQTSVVDQYIFADVLRELNEPFAVEELLQLIREQPQRFMSNYEWASAMTKAILAFDPARLDELILFCIEAAGDAGQRESALAVTLLGARSRKCAIGPQTIDLFDGASLETKRLLLPFLFAEGRREALRRAFNFIEFDENPPPEGRGLRWSERDLTITGREDVIEVLAALPDVPVPTMLTARSPLLGPLAPIMWRQRTALRAHCVEILQSSGMEAKVFESAIRILVFLAEPSICDLCEALAKRGNTEVRGFAALAPSMVPALVDRGCYEARLLDPELPMEDRIIALSVLASVGGDLGVLYTRLKAIEVDPGRVALWDFFFLQNSAQAPFPAAIPMLEEHLSSPEANNAGVFLSALIVLGELPVPEATSLLVRALSHPNRSVRVAAASALRDLRSRTALASLVERYRTEAEVGLGTVLATAIVASGPQSVAVLQKSLPVPPHVALWQCILATRLRDVAFADQLVTIANERSSNWQLRRAAITAAGRLPFDAALERIVPVVMQERSPLIIDAHQSLQCHATLAWLLLKNAQGLLPGFMHSRRRFVDLLAELLDESWKGLIDRRGLPTGAQAAGWLHDRLSHRGWPANADAPDVVINELHVPLLHSAVLRSLRWAGRPDLIEAELPRGDHIWLTIKCITQRFRAGAPGPDLAARLRDIVGSLPFRNEPLLERIIKDFEGTGMTAQAGAPFVPAVETVSESLMHFLSYDDAVLALSGEAIAADFRAGTPAVLGTVTKEQFEHLVRLAEPMNDRHRTTERYIPQIAFTRDGHSVAQRQITYTGASEALGSWIRPALAAANRFGLNIRWHEELLSGVFADTYAKRLIACLEAQDDAERFYEEIYRYPDLLLPHLCGAAQQARTPKYLDTKMVPLLSMFMFSGTDDIFAGLCALARGIDSPEIDNVLTGLFRRWTQRFDARSPVTQHRENIALWRGFKHLETHPRFAQIKGWQSLLSTVLHSQLAWYHGQEVARVLERDPHSYIQIESLLFKSEDWEHFRVDEIDRLDDAAERLFWDLPD